MLKDLSTNSSSFEETLRCDPPKQADQLLGPYAFQRRLMTVLRKGYDGSGLLTGEAPDRMIGDTRESVSMDNSVV